METKKTSIWCAVPLEALNLDFKPRIQGQEARLEWRALTSWQALGLVPAALFTSHLDTGTRRAHCPRARILSSPSAPPPRWSPHREGSLNPQMGCSNLLLPTRTEAAAGVGFRRGPQPGPAVASQVPRRPPSPTPVARLLCI